jgi:hypothetical protein
MIIYNVNKKIDNLMVRIIQYVNMIMMYWVRKQFDLRNSDRNFVQ